MATTQYGALTRRRFPGINYENLVQVQAANLPKLYAATQEQDAADLATAQQDKELQLAQDRMALENTRISQEYGLAQEQMNAASKNQMVGNLTGTLGLGLNLYSTYKTAQLIDKLTAAKGATDTVTGVTEPGIISKGWDAAKSGMEYIGDKFATGLGLKAPAAVAEPTAAVSPSITTGNIATSVPAPNALTQGAIKATPELGAIAPTAEATGISALPQATTSLVSTNAPGGLGLASAPANMTSAATGLPVNSTAAAIDTNAALFSEGSALAPTVTETGVGMSTVAGAAPAATETATTTATGATAGTSSMGVLGPAAIVALASKLSYGQGERLMEDNERGSVKGTLGKALTTTMSNTGFEPLGAAFERTADAVGMSDSNDIYRALTTFQIQERQAKAGLENLLAGNFEQAGKDIRASLTPAPIARALGKGWLCVATMMYFGMNIHEIRLTQLISVYSMEKYGTLNWLYLHNGYRLIKRIKASGVNLREFFGNLKPRLIGESIEYVKKGDMNNAAYNYWRVVRELFERFMPELNIPRIQFDIIVKE